MLLFGLLTSYNIRNQQHRILLPSNQNRPTDTQSTIMLIAQISDVIIFTGPFCVAFLTSTFMSEEQVAEALILVATASTDQWQTVSNSASFVCYTVTVALYRQELIKLFHRCYNSLRQH